MRVFDLNAYELKGYLAKARAMQNVEVDTRLQTVFFPQLLEGFVGRAARFIVDDQRTRWIGGIVSQSIDRAFCKAAKAPADLIVITSPYSPYEFFYEQGNNADTDGFDQLERRLAAVIEMQQREICLCQYAGNGWYLPMPDYTRPNPYSRFARGDDSSADPTKVYESVLGTSADSSD